MEKYICAKEIFNIHIDSAFNTCLSNTNLCLKTQIITVLSAFFLMISDVQRSLNKYSLCKTQILALNVQYTFIVFYKNKAEAKLYIFKAMIIM
jgi:hypothetical protein